MGINTQFNAKGLFKLFAGASLALLITSPSFAGTVAITYEDAGTSTGGAGAHNLTIDGVSYLCNECRTSNTQGWRYLDSHCKHLRMTYKMVPASSTKQKAKTSKSTTRLVGYSATSASPIPSAQTLSAGMLQSIRLCGK